MFFSLSYTASYTPAFLGECPTSKGPGGIRTKKVSGFTIVELLIVVVVVAILAAVTIVSFSGIQKRARDSQRVADITTIVKALEMYKYHNGQYPAAISNSAGGWEISSNPNDNHDFLQQLVGPTGVSKVPVDPINTGDMTIPNSKIYAYYRYPAGTSGCPTAFYILTVRSGESSVKSPSSPGGTCGTYISSGWWTKVQPDIP